MDEKLISRLAHAEKPPESALPHEWLLWYRLRDLYRAVDSGAKSISDARAEKTTAINSFHADREAYEQNILLWKRIEPAAKAFAREQTIETANDFYESVYRMRPARHEKEKDI